MLLFSDQGAGFAIYRTTTEPNMLSDRSFSVQYLGTISHLSDCWEIFWDRDPVYYREFYASLQTNEKRGIIGLLDRLNQIERKETDNLKRWNEIIGLDPPSAWSDIVVEDYNADNPWSDTVAKIEAARADNTLA